MESKARIVRFWFVAVALGLLGIWQPALWIGLAPLFFWGGCPCCGCTNCASGAPQTFQVDLSGFTNAGVCPSCSIYNDSFIVDSANAASCALGISDTDCCWVYEIPSGYCSVSGVPVKYVALGLVSSGADVDLRVTIYGTSITPPTLATWREFSITPDPDCSAFSGRVVPHLSHVGVCNHDSSPALVTAL